MQEWPKWMHRTGDDGKVESKVFAKSGDVPEGEGWTETAPEGEKAQDDGTNVSLAQRQAADDLKAAEERKRIADQNAPPSTASPAADVAPKTNTDGHNGIEFRGPGGQVLMVADVDTMERDKLQNTLTAMGVKYDGRWTEDKLRSTLTSALANPQETAVTGASIGTTDTRQA